MATGTGTQSDPRIVYNWDELADAFQNYYYIELGGDINAPQESASLAGGQERAVSLNRGRQRMRWLDGITDQWT